MDFYGDIVSELETFFHSINSTINFEKLVPPITNSLIDTDSSPWTKRRKMKHRASFLVERVIAFRRRHIVPCKREVFVSNEIKCKLSCDEFLRITPIVEEIISDFRSGNDINGRLSEQADNPETNDAMLWEWNLYHLHLGKGKKNANSKLYQRTGHLLIVYIPEDTPSVYLIDISEKHKNNNVVFSRKRYLEIIDNNWPELLSEYEMHGITPEHSLTDEERAALRSHHVNAFNHINGKMIGNPGIGITCAGTSILHTMQADYYMNKIDQLEKQCRGLQKEYVPRQIPEYKNYKLKFNSDTWEFYLVEYEPQRAPIIVSIIPL